MQSVIYVRLQSILAAFTRSYSRVSPSSSSTSLSSVSGFADDITITSLPSAEQLHYDEAVTGDEREYFSMKTLSEIVSADILQASSRLYRYRGLRGKFTTNSFHLKTRPECLNGNWALQFTLASSAVFFPPWLFWLAFACLDHVTTVQPRRTNTSRENLT